MKHQVCACCAGGKVKLPDLRSRPEPLLTLVSAVGPTFVLMDNNARPHRADIVDDYLKRRDCAYGVSSRFPPPATLIELEIALQEEWRLLNSAVVYHLIESMVRR
ncbi:transposable element Tcb2 transposase [Trichonephila clavipes]|nr:transposable element Tcb2 transposase [Trichonephila clavipes]